MNVVGNAIVGQSGGPTVVINQSLAGIALAARKHSGAIKSVLGAVHAVKGILEENLIDLSRESVATIEAVAKTPCAGLGSVRKKPTRDECVKMFEVMKAHDVRYFFYIGGNDSAESASIVHEIAREEKYDLRVFHVPKTIDNDLLVTDHCPGYGSAARFVAMALMGDDLDNRSLPGIKIDVVMGRHAGFLTAASVLARTRDGDGPHLVYVPERPFSKDAFLADVDRVYKKLGRCVIAASEGISDASGKAIGETGEKDQFGNVQLSGSGALGDLLSAWIKKGLGEKLRVRADTLGYLQRSFPGVASEVDAREARMVGEAAVAAAVSGAHESGSIAIERTGEGKSYSSRTIVTTLASVAKATKPLDPKWISPAGNDIERGFVDYAAPLVGALPEMGRFERFPVPKRRT